MEAFSPQLRGFPTDIVRNMEEFSITGERDLSSESAEKMLWVSPLQSGYIGWWTVQGGGEIAKICKRSVSADMKISEHFAHIPYTCVYYFQ